MFVGVIFPPVFLCFFSVWYSPNTCLIWASLALFLVSLHQSLFPSLVCLYLSPALFPHSLLASLPSVVAFHASSVLSSLFPRPHVFPLFLVCPSWFFSFDLSFLYFPLPTFCWQLLLPVFCSHTFGFWTISSLKLTFFCYTTCLPVCVSCVRVLPV